MMTTNDPLMERALALKLFGLLAHWDEIAETGWIEALIQWEELERTRRSLERRLTAAHLGHFKPLADFDWQWPGQCDRQAIEELMQLHDRTQYRPPGGTGRLHGALCQRRAATQ